MPSVDVEKVLNTLRGALGTGESPPGSNSNFIVKWYNDNVDRIGNGPWCEMTQTWAMWTSGAKSLKNGRAYTVWACEDAVKGVNGSSWHYGVGGMKAGDAVYYDWSGRKGNYAYVDHVGTVERINGDGTFYVLEGNQNDKLVRVLRDSKFVVGYVRFNWAAIAKDSSVQVIQPRPPVYPVGLKPLPSRSLTVRLQKLLGVTTDSKWGSATDAKALMMRKAARAYFGYPKPVGSRFDVAAAQRVLGVAEDRIVGPKTKAALKNWIIKVQTTIGVDADGSWGPKTDAAFLSARKANLNRY